MFYISDISSILYLIAGWLIWRPCIVFCNMDRIINVMGFCHSYCRCSNDHICVQGNRNLKIRSSLIARRQIFLTVNYYSGKFLTAELDGCVCLTLLYSDTFTSDLRFPCAAFKGKSICCICTISKCKNRYYILCILFCILTVFFQTFYAIRIFVRILCFFCSISFQWSDLPERIWHLICTALWNSSLAGIICRNIFFCFLRLLHIFWIIIIHCLLCRFCLRRKHEIKIFLCIPAVICSVTWNISCLFSQILRINIKQIMISALFVHWTFDHRCFILIWSVSNIKPVICCICRYNFNQNRLAFLKSPFLRDLQKFFVHRICISVLLCFFCRCFIWFFICIWARFFTCIFAVFFFRCNITVFLYCRILCWCRNHSLWCRRHTQCKKYSKRLFCLHAYLSFLFEVLFLWMFNFYRIKIKPAFRTEQADFFIQIKCTLPL